MDTPNSLQQAIIWFSDPTNCHNFMVELRWPDGVVKCPSCGGSHVVYLENAKRWKCYAKHPSPTFTLKTNTIFEDSPLGLDKWLAAAWLIINCKNGISSYEISRDLKITQKTAWFMLHRIRLAMQSGTFDKLSGKIEADETFIGGKARNMGAKDKTAVMGILERGGKVITKVIENRKKKALQSELRTNVVAGSAIFTDALKSYEGLTEFQHEVIDHL